MRPPHGLSHEDLRVIYHAGLIEHLPDDGSRHQHIRTHLGLPYTTFLQRLNRLLDNQAALAQDPQLIARLRRRREERLERRGHRVPTS